MLSILTNSPDQLLCIGGLVIGVLFGALLQTTGFCMMGAVSDAVVFRDVRRLQAVMLAMAIAIVAVTMLDLTGLIQTSQSIYLGSRLNWIGALAGGLVFGIGMVLAGGCPSRALTRAGGGDMRALITLAATGIAGYIAISGVLGPARVALEAATAIDLKAIGVPTQAVPSFLSAWLGLPQSIAAIIAATVIVAGLLLFAFWHRGLSKDPVLLASAVGVALLVTAAWALTSAAYDDLSLKPSEVQALSFVKPVGDTLDWLQRSTALGWPTFAVSTVFGTLIGSTAAAVIRGQFRFAGFADRSDLVRNMAGAGMMGVGGVLALGCSIGNGVSGVSVLSAGSIIATAAILLGARIGLSIVERLIGTS